MSSKLKVLIPDGDSTWAMAVIHCLCLIEDYSLFVLSNKKRTPSKYSKYTNYYKYYNRSTDDLWLEVIYKEVELHEIDIIVPVAEKEILFFIRNQTEISAITKVIPLPDLASFQTASNKKNLSEFCELQNLPHPKSVLSLSDHFDTINKSAIGFPVLIKPLDQKGGDGILKINSSEEFNTIQDNLDDDIFVQEFIEGYDIDCSVLCQDGRILCYTIQKGNLKGNNDFAPQLGFDLYENPKVLEVVSKTMSVLNWSGIAHLDLRYDERSEQYLIIEINPRFWGSLGASLYSGVNFPHMSILLAYGKPIPNNQFKPGQYMRLKGVIKTIRKNPSFIFKRKYMLEQTEVKSFIKDPMPTMHRFLEWIGRKLK